MRTLHEIEERRAYLGQRILSVELKRSAELLKPLKMRNTRYLLFLDREDAVWRAAVAEIDWIVGRVI